MKIAPCPCCCGTARVFAVIIEEVKMWQIGCTACGLATEYDDSKEYLLKNWNRRKQLEKSQHWHYLLLSITLVAGIAIFFCGYIVAIKSLYPL